ncbi:hypothetical protein COV16_00140 [Candidatus Woesearchaeota archaeon CG10_big_fil_rev_8_21_14_0_10_34_8]|nr:MAG: hypothetical protein COV16_00140 [Candidatus Woesearchaeota archaeon CG10_big_fil_rev_8_21_14_0_10_34_8]
MIKKFEYYVEKNMVKKGIRDISLAKSLIKKAEARLERIKTEEISEAKSALIFEDAYEAVREAAQSLMQVMQYKPYSHEAVVAFVKDNKYLDENNSNKFNNYRILRNKSVYLAENISEEKSKEAVEFAKDIVPKMKAKLFEMLKYDTRKNK